MVIWELDTPGPSCLPHPHKLVILREFDKPVCGHKMGCLQNNQADFLKALTYRLGAMLYNNTHRK